LAAGGQSRRRQRRERPDGAALRSPLTTFVALAALLFQLLVLPYHQALSAPAPTATDIAAVASELKATFGDAAALCVQSDGKDGSGAPMGDCDDHCPLCQFAAQAAALITPDAPALPALFRIASGVLGGGPASAAPPASPNAQHRARAPPFAV
jgi:hypothetical protein